MHEWEELLQEANRWLEVQWKQEIASSPWHPENQLYHVLKRKLRGIDVVQHAQPVWLAPQHFDVFIPSVSVAVEYMGRQHFEPIDFFGGQWGMRMIQERDSQKAQLCDRYGVDLLCIRYDDHLGSRVEQVVNAVKKARQTA